MANKPAHKRRLLVIFIFVLDYRAFKDKFG
jgi:hypothetical protein